MFALWYRRFWDGKIDGKNSKTFAFSQIFFRLEILCVRSRTTYSPHEEHFTDKDVSTF